LISVLLPSKNRPEKFANFVDSAKKLAMNPNSLEFVVYRDKSDTSDYPEMSNVKYISGDLKDIPSMYNLCASKAKHNIFFLAADDVLVRTKDWDFIVSNAFEVLADPLIGIHGDDLGQNPLLHATHFFISSKCYEVLGFVFPVIPGFIASDLWLTNLLDYLNKRVFIVDLIIEHLHPVWGKGSLDLTYKNKFVSEKKFGIDYFNPRKVDEFTSQVVAKIMASRYWMASGRVENPVLIINLELKLSAFFYKRNLLEILRRSLRWRLIKIRLCVFERLHS